MPTAGFRAVKFTRPAAPYNEGEVRRLRADLAARVVKQGAAHYCDADGARVDEAGRAAPAPKEPAPLTGFRAVRFVRQAFPFNEGEVRRVGAARAQQLVKSGAAEYADTGLLALGDEQGNGAAKKARRA